MVAHWPTFLPCILQDIRNSDHTVRAYGCYGTSFAARQAAFSEYASEVLEQLVQVVQASRGRAKKKSEKSTQMAADNALSAIAEILLHQPSVAAAKVQAWSVWLSALPIQEDTAEGQRNHKVLLELLQKQTPELLGEGGQNLGKIIAVLVEVYETDMAEEELSKEIGITMKSIGSQLESCAASLSTRQKKKLARMVREAAKH